MNNWLVAEFNQASRQCETIHGPYWNEQDAQDAADTLRTYTASTGRRETYPEDES